MDNYIMSVFQRLYDFADQYIQTIHDEMEEKEKLVKKMHEDVIEAYEVKKDLPPADER